MNEAACVVYIGGFLLLPPALLLTRWFDQARMPWRILLGLSVLGGWLFVNLAYMFYINSLEVQMIATGDWMSTKRGIVQGDLDAFPKNDALFRFGGLFGPIYLVPWLLLYGLFAFVLRRR